MLERCSETGQGSPAVFLTYQLLHLGVVFAEYIHKRIDLAFFTQEPVPQFVDGVGLIQNCQFAMRLKGLTLQVVKIGI